MYITYLDDEYLERFELNHNDVYYCAAAAWVMEWFYIFKEIHEWFLCALKSTCTRKSGMRLFSKKLGWKKAPAPFAEKRVSRDFIRLWKKSRKALFNVYDVFSIVFMKKILNLTGNNGLHRKQMTNQILRFFPDLFW